MSDAELPAGAALPGEAPLGRPVAPPPEPALTLPAAPSVTEHGLRFTGTAGEYFRVWIVNVALTLVTLGIYLPWARVRTRQYFYGHTWLDGHNFEYRANPLALLRGYLVVGALFVTYGLAANFERWWIAAPILLLYVGLYPWLVRQSLRFQAANTVHRGLNFRFHGTTGGAYVSYGAANILGGIFGIFALPWAWFMQRRYQLDHLAFGTASGRFRGDVAPFYVIAVTALGVGIGLAIALLIPLGVVLGASEAFNNDPFDRTSAFSTATIASVVLAYLGFLTLYAVLWQYVRAAIMKYVLDHAELGGVVRTRGLFKPWTLVWIGVSNSLAVLLTLGLATPWAAIRRARYVLEGVQVRAIAPLDDFAAGQSGAESPLGEAASELLDIQVGF